MIWEVMPLERSRLSLLVAGCETASAFAGVVADVAAASVLGASMGVEASALLRAAAI